MREMKKFYERKAYDYIDFYDCTATMFINLFKLIDKLDDVNKDEQEMIVAEIEEEFDYVEFILEAIS